MLLIDYHTHTKYSPDSNMSIEELITTSISKGLKEICITDHVDNIDSQNYNIPNYNKFFDELELFKNKYTQLKIKFGAEFSLSPNLVEKANALYSSYNYDFVIGSSHECCNNFLYSNTPFFNGKTKKEDNFSVAAPLQVPRR